MNLYSFRIPVCLSILIFLFSACTEKPKTPPQQKSTTPSRTEITIAAVGDIMMPGSIQRAAARNENKYEVLFEKIAADLGAADITIANLETPVDDKREISGYPKFNAGVGVLTALKKAGVDVVSIANNHIMDAGVEGLRRTLDNIAAAGLLSIGAGRTKSDTEEIKYISVRNIKVAFLAYAYATNQRLPGRKPADPGVNVLRVDSKSDLGLAAEKVKIAKRTSDLIVVSIHWGNEYDTHPTMWQRKVARELIESGADIILGHHPHVLQPVETYTTADGRQGVVAFSLGNFTTSQNYGISYASKNKSQALRGDSVILFATIAKEAGKTSVTRVELMPTWSLRDQVDNVVVYRPVSIAREIERISSQPKLSEHDEEMIKLLSFRQRTIIEKFSPKPNRPLVSQ